jgi:hypothetical protein
VMSSTNLSNAPDGRLSTRASPLASRPGTL